MTDILQHPYLPAFARALMHFVWQGAAIGIVGYVLLRSARLSATARHTTGVALLAVMLATPVATTWFLVREAPASGGVTAATEFAPGAAAAGARVVTAPPAPIAASSPTPSNTAPLVSPVVVLALWLAGVIVLSIRLVGGWIVARRMARRAIQLAAPDVQRLARLRRAGFGCALDRVVRIVESSTICVPVMVGWIKPVVILPTAALAGLTPLQVEALLRSRIGAYPASRLPGEPPAVGRRDGAVLSPGRLVGVARSSRSARAMLRRPGRGDLRSTGLRDRTRRARGDGENSQVGARGGGRIARRPGAAHPRPSGSDR